MDAAVQAIAAKSVGDRNMKVNHAGEHRAICIYSSQIHMARFTAPAMVGELTEVGSHELGHRAIFGAELRRGRPRCRSYWLCGLGGYLLGLITGICGASAIAATTVAVESVVLRHLEQQLVALQGHDPGAVSASLPFATVVEIVRDASNTRLSCSSFAGSLRRPVRSSRSRFSARIDSGAGCYVECLNV
ncbi:demethoxyubiquinone hydroxylase family protein [Lysobacter sp. S4-A87]|uniref:demethoxyubiquinone hydroxylase family protein n=1 Tax=Lysobacter sp. S4-A87 TaxID=2925843 RepID=UPI001F53DD19|nr:demethoxyubiquinone hydroxylase family protein [Lysobacter sp. S4-A87]UNK50634.1 demethoxyubiquinone hydroxylase family protein [Lysobacter sp. S4-A87]